MHQVHPRRRHERRKPRYHSSPLKKLTRVPSGQGGFCDAACNLVQIPQAWRDQFHEGWMAEGIHDEDAIDD
jgi:hypothetical protein